MKARKITALLLSATMMATLGLTGCGSGGTGGQTSGGTTSEGAKTETQAQPQAAAGSATELTFWRSMALRFPPLLKRAAIWECDPDDCSSIIGEKGFNSTLG